MDSPLWLLLYPGVMLVLALVIVQAVHLFLNWIDPNGPSL